MNETKIFDYICQKVDHAFLQRIAEEQRIGGVTAKEIEGEFQIYRSNASTLLNQLVKKGDLVKVESRPVYFFPANVVQRHLGEPPAPSYSLENFLALLRPSSAKTDKTRDPFSLLIGASGSLQQQVKQAKAAVLYPPTGLHTMLIGESGIGKTLFARTMHNYGLQALEKTIQEYPYVEFNCADYYHNPQLLMSQLFGYIKGAFTGASEEKEGLVEKANGGILFLDEVHRLPPEGQELLFYLIDTGHYRKLGESSSNRKAKILIIAATTEDPKDVLLKTFMRRIPLTISLPPFREKPIEERIKLVEHIFVRESTATQKNYIISPRVIKGLAAFDYPGNIGQLSSEVKVLCAHSFLNDVRMQDDLTIRFAHLSEPVRQNYLSRSQQFHFPSQYDADVLITPASTILYSQSKLLDEKAYQNLLESIEVFTAKGYSKDEMNEALAGEIEEYYSNVLKNVYTQNLYREEMYKVVDPGIVDFTIEVMQEAFQALNLEVTQKNILVMAFHIKYLLERLETAKTITPNEITHIQQEYAQEVGVAEQIVQRIERHFRRAVPKEEKYFIAILLANTGADYQQGKPGLFIIAHGDSTATSMANVCNRLMDCSFVRAVDAPLDQSVQDTYQAVLREVRKSNPEKGAILLVDMGSLAEFGARITEETGIPTRTIPDVTTLMALDFTRVLLGKEDDIGRICDDYLQKNRQPGPCGSKKSCIITLCATGTGTSEAFKTVIDEELAQRELSHIKVVALSYQDVQQHSPKYKQIRDRYNVLACVGNLEYQLDIPFYHVSRLISSKDKESFIKFISGLDVVNTAAVGMENSLHQECRQILSKNITFLNPDIAVKYAAKYLDAIEVPKITQSDSLQLSLILHLGFMLERNICGNKVIYDNEGPFIQQNKQLFQTLRGSMPVLEDPFSISINDSEICFIMQTILGSK